jgi:hypothetical protein
VDRRAHQRRLHRALAHEGAGEVGELEPLQARPEADVRGRRVLCLEPGDLLEGAGEGQRRTREQELAREQRPVQLACRENPLGHARPSLLARFGIASGA